MLKEYGTSLRKDPTSALEQIVSPPIRQINPQRVTEVQGAAALVIASVFSSASAIGGPPDDGSAPVTAAWNQELLDTDTMHDNAVNNNRITIPTGKPGMYKCSCRIVFTSNGTTTNRIVKIRINGTVVKTVTVAALAGADIAVYAEHQQYLQAGDYYDILLDATGGSGTLANYNPTSGPDVSSVVVTKIN
jgi:hypothetical protein